LLIKNLTLIVLCAALLPLTGKSQDTVLLLNGDLITGKILADNGDHYQLEIIRRHNVRTFAVDKLDIFSVIVRGQGEKVVYKIDTSLGNDFTVSQMRDFREGEHWARQHYKPVLPLLGGALAGAAGPVIGFWGFTIAPVYLGCLSLKKPAPPPEVQGKTKIADPEFFTMGYKYTAKRKKIEKAALGALGGIVTVWVIKVAASGLQ